MENQAPTNLTFRKVIDKELRDMGRIHNNRPSGGHVSRGLYVTQLERVSSLFPDNQIALACQEHVSQTLDYSPFLDFLGVKEMTLLAGKHRQTRPESCLRADNGTLHKLDEFFRPWNELLLGWIRVHLRHSPRMLTDMTECVKGWLPVQI